MSRDFYQASFAGPVAMATEGLYRDGAHLVVDLAAHSFPDRCLKTDEPIQGAHTGIELTTYNVAAEELGLVRGLVVASTNQLLKINQNNKGNNVVVTLGVPLTPGQAQRLRSPWPLVVVGLSILFTLACFAGTFFAVDPNNATLFFALLFGCVVGVAAMIGGFVALTLRSNRVLSIKRLADRKVWLRGVHADWLARLPEYAASVELLQRDLARAVSSRWWSFFWAMLFGCATLVCAPIAVRGYLKGVASRDWPAVQGTIGHVWISRHTSTRKGRTREWWHVNFDYSYEVNGQIFSGTTHEREETEVAAQNHAQRRPRGTPIDVFHDPKNPSDNRAKRGLSKAEVGWIIAASIVGIISFIATLYGLMARARAAGFQQQLDERQRLVTRV